jgi:NADPH:quinone reductase-like Zn-dependent oxidoreductase/SAM-dependent methyltransferase
MGRNIVRAIKGETEPLQVIMEDKLMHRYYDQLILAGDLPTRFMRYLELLDKDRNGLSILEVGAGTGSATALILDILSPRKTAEMGTRSCKIAKYTFTDISSGFFENAKERFKQWSDIMAFQTLDAETDAGVQGFEPESHDLIFAGNVIHATADLRKTLSNLRQLLKPGGKIILQEFTRAEFRAQIAFGQLPGWWLSMEKNRKLGPILSPPEWDVVLEESGFSGIDIEMPSSQIPEFHYQSILVSSAVAENRSLQKTIVIVKDASKRLSLLGPITDCVSNRTSSEVIVADLAGLHEVDVANAGCISLLEIGESILQDLDEDAFTAIKTLLSKCTKLLWITGDPVAKPQLNMATGLLRTLRWEKEAAAANLVTFAISDPGPSEQDLAQALGRVYEHQFLRASEDDANAEYMYQNGIVYANRFQPSQEGNNFLLSKSSVPSPEKQLLKDVDYPIKLSTSSPGLLDKLEWIPDTSHMSPLGDTEVEIDIRAVGLNFRDLMIAMGEYKAFSLGVEAAGIVSKVGSSVTKLQPGDRVVYISSNADNGCFRTKGRVDECLVVKIPPTLSFEIAAGLPCIYGTVIYGLRDVARLTRGETILIHAAAGGVGQAAMHYCKMVGAEIYATVSTPEKRQLLVQEYGVREDRIFPSRDLSFAQGIMRITKGKGVDVVLNSLSGEALRRTWECIAPFGRFIEIGNKDAHQHGKLDLNPFVNNVTMASVNLQTMTEHRPELVGRLIADTVELYTEGKIKEVTPVTVMNFGQVEDGLRLLQSGKGMGKYVFVPGPEDYLPVVPQAAPPYVFREDASYVLAGGLGGLGRSIARWMVSRNAKSLIFLSRSARITAPVEDMVAEFKEKGCRVEILKCDVSNSARLKEAIDGCVTTMPPIKGCIQGAMSLNVRAYVGCETIYTDNYRMPYLKT